jgi:transposase-like protein
MRVLEFNQLGTRIGETHPAAKFSDREVQHIRDLRREGVSTREIARRMKCSRGYVFRVIRGTTRAQTPAFTIVVEE